MLFAILPQFRVLPHFFTGFTIPVAMPTHKSSLEPPPTGFLHNVAVVGVGAALEFSQHEAGGCPSLVVG